MSRGAMVADAISLVLVSAAMLGALFEYRGGPSRAENVSRDDDSEGRAR